MVLFDSDEGGDRYRDWLAWYEFTFWLDEGPESYANCMSERGTDNPGGGGGGRIEFVLRKGNTCGISHVVQLAYERRG